MERRRESCADYSMEVVRRPLPTASLTLAHHPETLVVSRLSVRAAGEALWPNWADVDRDRRQVTFPKDNNPSPRSVPLHPRVMQAIAELPHKRGT